MWPRRYFAGRYFAPRYWSESQGIPSVVFIPGDWPQIIAKRQVRSVVSLWQDRRVEIPELETVAVLVQDRFIEVPEQVRRIVDPMQGE